MREDAGWPTARVPVARTYEDDHERCALQVERALTPARAALLDALDAALDVGIVPTASTPGLAPLIAAAIGPLPALHHAHEPLEPCAELPSEDEFASLCTDYWPEAGNEAPSLLLGAVGEQLDPRVPAQRRALVHCVAAGAMMESRGVLRSAHYVWAGRTPEPPATERARLRAVTRAPLSLWQIGARQGDRAVLTDLVGVHPTYQPTQPVDVGQVAWLYGSGAVGDVLVGRVALRSPRDPVLVHGVALPGPPPAAESVAAWRDAAMLRAWTRSSRARLEDVLRARGHAISRAWAMAWLAQGQA